MTSFPLNRKMRLLLMKLDRERSGSYVSGNPDAMIQTLVKEGLVQIMGVDKQGLSLHGLPLQAEERLVAHLTGKGRKWMEENRHLFTGNKSKIYFNK